jgi:hypothetical protein
MGFALCLLVFNNLALDHLVCGMWADGRWNMACIQGNNREKQKKKSLRNNMNSQRIMMLPLRVSSFEELNLN